LPEIRIVGFRGVGFENPQFEDEPALIRAGHVGISLDTGKTIYGFQPSVTAVNEFTELGIDILEFLKEGGAIRGQIYDERKYFIALTN
jgi:hypothetical protein